YRLSIMVKYSVGLAFLATTIISAVLACDDACTAVSDRGGRCYYACIENACHFTGQHHRDQFLNGLGTRGYSCRPEGATTLSCDKNVNNFGNCWSHKWQCGDC
ncbi:hypothetical protein BDF20DRAFT_812637, partial [Mycotypha africana]|uniref:uncharacterized protein n=1 Tax=Mycotypha africana TaxID=64632 RepID=UPI002301C51D